jgi:hypothetical protein
LTALMICALLCEDAKSIHWFALSPFKTRAIARSFVHSMCLICAQVIPHSTMES